MGGASNVAQNQVKGKLVLLRSRRRKNDKPGVSTLNGSKKHLLDENIKEDAIIAQLEKNLKLKKKSSCLTKSFCEDGLDYLLETCDMVSRSKNSKKRSSSPSDSDDSTAKRSAKDPFREMRCPRPIINSSDSDCTDDSSSVGTVTDESISTDDGITQLGSNIGREMTIGIVNNAVNGEIIDSFDDKVLLTLKKHIKGSINRLAEANMHKIATQIESLYMCNSRNNMNRILVEVVMSSVASSTRTPERLVLEMSMLIAILHANVDMSVGANVVHEAVQNFDRLFDEVDLEDCKKIDNTVVLLAFLYNFKVVGDALINDILKMFAERFSEKDVELILLLLRIVGISLRKNNSSQLKELILTLQKKATAAKEMETGSRAQFMLDVLLAIKNNNVQKIPNYDSEHMEHLKKTMKSFLHPGCCCTPINMTVGDILKVGEQGILRCSASGLLPEDNIQPLEDEFRTAVDEPIFKLAKRHRMNTDQRRSIFTILVTSEDYLDAFEKILHLQSKSQQDYEVMNLIVHCTMQEKVYNPYYQYLACHLCHFNRKYLVSLQYSVWDKLDELNKLKKNHISNLAKFVGSCIVEKGLPLSSLKVVDFSMLNEKLTNFLKEAMLIILTKSSLENYQLICQKVTSPKLSVFKESLWLYVKHILDTSNIVEYPGNFDNLKQRVEMMSSIFGLV